MDCVPRKDPGKHKDWTALCVGSGRQQEKEQPESNWPPSQLCSHYFLFIFNADLLTQESMSCRNIITELPKHFTKF
jgi:hypothetical protein